MTTPDGMLIGYGLRHRVLPVGHGAVLGAGSVVRGWHLRRFVRRA